MATRRSVLALGVAVLPLVVATGAEAAPPAASYACRADTKFGRHLLSLRQGVDAKAPATVPPNTRFTVAVDLEPGSLPGEVRGFTLKEVRDLSLRVPIPANSSYITAPVSCFPDPNPALTRTVVR
jgi:dehydratase